MTKEKQICERCGQARVDRKDASLTQWILRSGSCACDLVGPADESHAPKRCGVCGKYVLTGRKGSLTQWILRLDACTCGKNEAIKEMIGKTPAVALTRSMYEEQSDEHDDQLISLDADQFPTRRYAPIKELGRGGTGSVYLCRDLLLDKKVAVKILHSLSSTQLIAFQDEARAVSKLDHPNVVKLLDFGPTESGIPFMVMEYFHGITLKNYIEQNGALDLTTAISVFSDVCAALSAAHSVGIYHRDLTSSNILLSGSQNEDQRVKIIDFGLAIVKQNAGDAIHSELAGTPAYMAPDTAQGKPFDARSEVYTLGCVLFEALTGRVPFEAVSALDVLNLHAHATPPRLCEVTGTAFPNEMETLVHKSLAKDPDDRIQSIADFQEALYLVSIREQRSAFVNPSAFAAPVKPERRIFIILYATAISVIAISIPAVYWYLNFYKPKEPKPAAKRPAISDTAPQAAKADLDELEKAQGDVSKLEKIASGGDIKAQVKLGDLYMIGKGVKADYTQAGHWYRLAAEKDSGAAQHHLGILYLRGLGVERDPEEAIKWFLLAAKKGDIESQIMAGELYKGHFHNYKEAVKWYRLASDRGHPMAQCLLGTMILMGYGTPKDPDKALVLLRKSAASGIPEAFHAIGWMYESGIGVKADHKEAMKWHVRGGEAVRSFNPALKQSGVSTALQQGPNDLVDDLEIQAKRGDLKAMFLIGVKKAGENNFEEAMKWFQMAGLRGEMNSQRLVGAMYDTGRGVEKDPLKAIHWFEMAAKQGDPTAQKWLATKFFYGKGVPKDIGKGVYWYEKAANAEDVSAQFELAVLYQRGLGVKRDYGKALALYKRASVLHPPEINGMIVGPRPGGEADYQRIINGYRYSMTRAQCNIGCMYEQGLGVKTDYKEAMKWFRQAAENGDPCSTANIGALYEEGKGVKKDFDEALTWYKRAAALGSGDAELRLSEIYEAGTGGVPIDKQESQVMLRRAAKHGNSEARELLSGKAGSR